MSDLIYRQAAIDLIKSWSGGYEYIETPTDTAVRSFEQLPSAQRTGRWRPYPIAEDCWQCSECGVLRMGDQSNYCPNCGCAMEGEEE